MEVDNQASCSRSNMPSQVVIRMFTLPKLACSTSLSWRHQSTVVASFSTVPEYRPSFFAVSLNAAHADVAAANDVANAAYSESCKNASMVPANILATKRTSAATRDR